MVECAYIGGDAAGWTPTSRTLGDRRLQPQADAADEASAADRHDDEPDLRPCLGDLEPHGRLAGDDIGVVVGRDVDRVAGVVAAPALELAVIGVAPEQLDRDAIRLERAEPLQLGRRDGAADEDGQPHPVPRGGGRARDAVVAAAGGDEDRVAVRGGDARDLHLGAADLECAGRLDVLALQADLGRTSSAASCGTGSSGVSSATPRSSRRAASTSVRVGNRAAMVRGVYGQGGGGRKAGLRGSSGVGRRRVNVARDSVRHMQRVTACVTKVADSARTIAAKSQRGKGPLAQAAGWGSGAMWSPRSGARSRIWRERRMSEPSRSATRARSTGVAQWRSV